MYDIQYQDVVIQGINSRNENKEFYCLFHRSKDKKERIAMIILPQTEEKIIKKRINTIVNLITKSLAKYDFSFIKIPLPPSDKITSYDTLQNLVNSSLTLDWLQITENFGTECILICLENASWVGLQIVMRRPEIKFFICIEVNLDKSQFNFLNPCPTPGLIITSKEEEKIKNVIKGSLSKDKKDKRIEYKVLESERSKKTGFFNKKDRVIISLIEKNLKRFLKNK